MCFFACSFSVSCSNTKINGDCLIPHHWCTEGQHVSFCFTYVNVLRFNNRTFLLEFNRQWFGPVLWLDAQTGGNRGGGFPGIIYWVQTTQNHLLSAISSMRTVTVVFISFQLMWFFIFRQMKFLDLSPVCRYSWHSPAYTLSWAENKEIIFISTANLLSLFDYIISSFIGQLNWKLCNRSLHKALKKPQWSFLNHKRQNICFGVWTGQ